MTFIRIPSPNYNDESEFGHRLPSKPIIAVIDFDSKEFSLSKSLEDIESYEIWSEDQSILFYSGNDVSDFVQVIAKFSDHSLRILINTSTYTLINIPTSGQ